MSQQDAVKPILSVPSRKRSGSTTDDNTPTTPRPTARFSDLPVKEPAAFEESTSNTPTRKNFSRVHGQRPLPAQPFPPSSPAMSSTADASTSEANSTLAREDSRRSVHSIQSNDSEDVDMADEDEGQDGLDQSDNDSVNSDSQRPSKKKKKGQRFYCTDFPPCQLSFTRSEHLARHIRKHTGERPFQCHCSRRFSRLDNLRQHAQTVHVNEEIPGDSLAATGTRFQRQIRTDRVRPPNTRPRASTASSHGGHSRGHSRNLSASSITSTASSVSMLDDVRPRPPPLNLTQDGASRARLSLEAFNPAIGSAGTQYGVFQQSPSGYSTPTSATFSAGASSPQFSSGMASPNSTISRSSFYNGTRTPSRRLSVPSGATSYQTSSHGMAAYSQPCFTTMAPSGASTFSNAGSIMASPTGTAFSHARRDSDAELDWRRRTWHPGTQSNYAPRPATSGLSYHQTPDDAAPAMSSQPAASQITRLPGIESFDHAPPPPSVPPRNVTSPAHAGHSRSQSYSTSGDSIMYNPDDVRHRGSIDAGLQQNLTKLEIGSTAAPRPSWTDQTRQFSNMRPTTAPHSGYSHQRSNSLLSHSLQPPAELRQEPADPPFNERERVNKRQAWYGGPIAPPPPPAHTQGGSQPILIAHRTSPESSSSDGVPTPSTSHGREMHPAIRHANGMVEMQPPGSVLTEEQQRMMQAHYNSKPEPIRADSGFHSYAHSQGQMVPMYTMHSGYDVQMQMQMQHGYAQAPPRQNNDMGRLEALVAVATSENRAVEHRS